MALTYFFIERKIPAGKLKGQKQWFAQVRTGDEIDVHTLAGEVSEQCTATPADVKAVLNALVTAMTTAMKAGRVVQIEGLGNFRLSAGSDGVAEFEDFSLNLMRPARVIFHPAKRLKAIPASAKYRAEKVRTLDITKDCEKEHIE